MEAIRDILEHQRLIIHFQPILSVRGRTFFGLEALVRGIDSNGELIPPGRLFFNATRYGLDAELDRLARHMAIEAFYPLWQQNNSLLLFVNFESSLIDTFEPGSYLFDGLLSHYGIPFNNIVLEIKEDEIHDTSRLQAFCDHYRALGFNIALDDFGVGRSSFDRLSIVRPDIIKIDRSLISGIETDYIHREIVHAICRMSTNIGAIALAEGIETLAEAAYAQQLGATLIQGFWIAKPSQHIVGEGYDRPLGELKAFHDRLQSDQRLHDAELRQQAEHFCRRFLEHVVSIDGVGEWDTTAKTLIHPDSNIEALYLIDENAKQVGPTLLQNKTRSFFEPMREGCDHSHKEYYTRALESLKSHHLTGNYVSLATGNLCCTYARKIAIQERPFVLCIDFIR